MKFKDPVNRKGLMRAVSPSGSSVYVKYKWFFNDDGDFVHEPVKKIDRYAEIQAERDSTDLQLMLKRYEAGDDTALQKVQGMYFDAQAMPKNYHELYRAVSHHNEVFESMPVQIKEKYDNNPAKFWKAYGTLDFDEFVNEFRSEVYASYAQVDPQPVNTSGEFKPEVQVEKGVVDEQKSE